MNKSAYALIHKLAGDKEDYGWAPAVGTAAKFLPVPFAGPLAAGITAGAEGEGRDTNESLSRGLHAGAGNLLGSILGAVGGGIGGAGLGVLGGLASGVGRSRSWGGLGPKRFTFDPEMGRAMAAGMAPIGAAAGAGIGNLYGGYKGTEAGIKHHRKSESERGEHAVRHYEGTKEKKDKKNDEEKEAQLRLIQKLAGNSKPFDYRGRASAAASKASPDRLAKAFAASGKGQERAAMKLENAQTPEQIQSATKLTGKRDSLWAGLRDGGEKKGSSDMRSIIDDIIKGAEQNSYGRPVSIQTNTEFSPIDMAKVAGAVVALSEKGYSVKEASEYLGLTERQIQDIVSTVG